MAAARLDSPILVCLDSHRRAVARSFRERATARLLCVSDARPLDATAELSQGLRKRFIAKSQGWSAFMANPPPQALPFLTLFPVPGKWARAPSGNGGALRGPCAAVQVIVDRRVAPGLADGSAGLCTLGPYGPDM